MNIQVYVTDFGCVKISDDTKHYFSQSYGPPRLTKYGSPDLRTRYGKALRHFEVGLNEVARFYWTYGKELERF